MEILTQILQTTIESFDFAYCLIVNVLTYFVIQLISGNNRVIKTWVKRLVLIACILLTGGVYYALGNDIKLLFNSAILSTVSWDLIFKPICKYFNIDYLKKDTSENN